MGSAQDNKLMDVFTELKKKRAFRKFSYRGVDLDQYVSLDTASYM